MIIVLCLGLALVAGDVVDRLAKPKRRSAPLNPFALTLRAGALTLIWLIALAVSQRPLYAVLVTVATVAVLVAISNEKRRVLREPLVFSDFAFLGAIVRYPHLFYLEALTIGLIAVGFAAAGAVTFVWWRIEPSSFSIAGEVLVVGSVLGLGLLFCLPKLGAFVAARLPAPAPEAHLPDLGLLGSLLGSSVAWLYAGRQPPADGATTALGTEVPYQAIVVIQAESFVDMRRHGVVDLSLPAYDALKSRALASGLLEVPCFGAYTLRPEMAVLTGFGFGQAGYDAFHPYLRGERFAGSAIPNRLPAGWRPQFIHPFDKSFFRRDRVIAAFGFATFTDRTAFDAADHAGPYVGDAAIAGRLLKDMAATRRDGLRPFVTVVTMEAHDPYRPDRIAEASAPSQQYLHHLANADRMLALIADELDRTWDRVLLVHYGDHVPLLSDKPGSFADTRTDYLVVELGRQARTSGSVREVRRPEDLHGVILDQFRRGPSES